jgi:hypothetical protein
MGMYKQKQEITYTKQKNMNTGRTRAKCFQDQWSTGVQKVSKNPCLLLHVMCERQSDDSNRFSNNASRDSVSLGPSLLLAASSCPEVSGSGGIIMAPESSALTSLSESSSESLESEKLSAVARGSASVA